MGKILTRMPVGVPREKKIDDRGKRGEILRSNVLENLYEGRDKMLCPRSWEVRHKKAGGRCGDGRTWKLSSDISVSPVKKKWLTVRRQWMSEDQV